MNTNKFEFRPVLLVLLAVLCLISYACTEIEDESRSASLLLVEQVVGLAGGEDGDESTPLLSDTCDNEDDEIQDPEFCTVFNDNAEITFSNEYLQIGPGVGTTPTFMNDVIVSQYRVDYFRSNGRSTPGVDVPFGIDGTMNVRVPINGTSEGNLVVVRHQSKREPPLAFLDSDPSENVITANAQLRFFGNDIAGREVTATGFLEIHWANFGEED